MTTKLDLSLDIASSGSALDWVKASRSKEKVDKETAKKQAELKKKQLEEEEDEILQQSSSLYSSKDLKGLRVMHAGKEFDEGKEIILTLADSNILETDEDGKVIGINEEEDILENVNLAEKDRKTNREEGIKKLRRPVYSGLDDYEFQEGVAPGTKAPILPQYEKEKKIQPKFQLGEGGVASLKSVDVKTDPDAAKLVESLRVDKKQISDFYTTQEYAKFKKSKGGKEKKKRRIRKEEQDLDEADSKDALKASLTNETKSMSVFEELEAEQKLQESNVQVKKEAGISSGPSLAPPIAANRHLNYEYQTIDLDEDDPEMAQALARARRIAVKKRLREEPDENAMQLDGDDRKDVVFSVEDQGAKMAKRLSDMTETKVLKKETVEGDEEENIDVDGRRSDGTLVFNSTTEFTTRLQARLNEQARLKSEAAMKELERKTLAKNKPKSEEEEVEIGGSADPGREVANTFDEFADDMEVDDHVVDETSTAEDEQLAFVHQQPLVAKGMAATLSLLKGTGELKAKEELAGRVKDARQLDPSSEDFGVKLEYRDDLGRKLTQKEAFRQLSYRFHGFGPSKKNQEKRQRVLDQENKARSSRTGILEGVGGTMKSLTQAQQATGKAHITVQGGMSNNAIAPPALAALLKKNKK